jgi:hypothetical protein
MQGEVQRELKKEETQRGYVKNEGTQAYFVCQRQIPPGGSVELDDIYQSVGKKSGLKNDREFVEWCKAHVFRRGSWGYYEDEGKPLGAKPVAKKATPKKAAPKKAAVSETGKSSKKSKDAKGAGRALRRDINAAEGITITPAAIIEAPYEQARGLIDKTRDRTILKKALALTQHFGGKEQHMRHIMKRMEQVY